MPASPAVSLASFVSSGQLPEWVTDLRPAQVDAVEQVLDAYARGKRLVVLEAPTGAGKSLIAELVRIKLGRGVYAATTKSLQAQILRDFDAAVLMGRRNYTPTHVPAGNDTAYGEARVTCEDCTAKRSDSACDWCLVTEQCPYRVARDTAFAHRLAVVNTAYLLTQIQIGREQGRITFGRDLLAVDECDELEGQLVDRAELTVTTRWQDRLAVDALGKGVHAQTVASWCKTTSETARAWANSQPRPPRPVEIERQVARGRELARKLQIVGGEYLFNPDGWVRDYDDRDPRRVSLKPVRVGQWGRELLWDRLGDGTRVLAMSATILGPDQWAEDVGLVGVDGCEDWEWEMVRVDSDFPVENRPIYMVPAVAMGRGEGWETRWEQMGEHVRATIALDNYAQTNTLIHTVSYALADRIVSAIVTNPHHRHQRPQRPNRNQERPVQRGVTANGRPVWTYSNGRQREEAIARYTQEGGVLVASSLERGADFADNLCGLMIVCKTPFPNLGDRRVNARMRQGRDGERWYARMTGRAVVQMTGRGVRNRDDHADTVILDRDFLRWYKNWKGLLPAWWTDAVTITPARAFLPNLT